MAYEQQDARLTWPQCRALMDIAKAKLDLIRGGNESYHTAGHKLVMPLYEDHSALQPFGGLWLFADLVILYPQGILHSHVDGHDGRLRRHIPIQTNDDAWCYHDRTWQNLVLGQVYTMAPQKPHGAVNWGSEPRVHLFFDVEKT